MRITRGVKFVTHDGGLWVLRNLGKLTDEDKIGRIVIKDNCNIGWDSIIMPGVTIGENCIVGAGAVVTKDVPDNSIVAGIPARVIETIDNYYEKNKKKLLHTKNMVNDEKRQYLLNLFGE